MLARRHAEVESAVGCQLSATTKWNLRLDASAAPRLAEIRVRIPARRHAEVEFAFRFQLGCQLGATPR